MHGVTVLVKFLPNPGHFVVSLAQKERSHKAQGTVNICAAFCNYKTTAPPVSVSYMLKKNYKPFFWGLGFFFF